MAEWETSYEVIDNLDALYGFYLLKNCLSTPKLYFFFEFLLTPFFSAGVSFLNLVGLIPNHLTTFIHVLLYFALLYEIPMVVFGYHGSFRPSDLPLF